MRRSKARAVTLIELMVAIAIVAVLATIALPTYLSYRLEAGRSTGAGCLIDAQYRLEQHYAKTASDAVSLAAAGVPARCGDGPHYQLRLDDGSACSAGTTAGAYALRAHGEEHQARDGDLVLCVAPSIANPNQRMEHLHSRPDTPAVLLPGWDFPPGQ